LKSQPETGVLVEEVRAAGGQLRTGRAGEVAFQWNGPPRYFVLLTRGSIRVHFRTKDRPVPWAECRALGGQDCMPVTSAILARSEIAMRAVYLTPSRWLVLPPEKLQDLVAENIVFRRALFRQHASRLPTFFARTSGRDNPSAEQRLAEWLLGNSDGGRIDVTHQQIASDLLTAREVVSRGLKHFVDAGWIEQGRGWIRVMRPKVLSKLAHVAPPSAGCGKGLSCSLRSANRRPERG